MFPSRSANCLLLVCEEVNTEMETCRVIHLALLNLNNRKIGKIEHARCKYFYIYFSSNSFLLYSRKIPVQLMGLGGEHLSPEIV